MSYVKRVNDVDVPMTPEDIAERQAEDAAHPARVARKLLEDQIAAAWDSVTLEDWALAQTDDAGGTQAGRDSMAAKLTQINTLKAQLAAL